MIICHCKAVSDSHVRKLVEAGSTRMADLARETGAGTDCHGCCQTLRAVLMDAKAKCASDTTRQPLPARAG